VSQEIGRFNYEGNNDRQNVIKCTPFWRCFKNNRKKIKRWVKELLAMMTIYSLLG